MTFLADESVDRAIIDRLRQDEHEIISIAEELPGVPDDVVLASAVREGIVLLTSDKDFGELVYRHRLPHAGVLLLRLAGLTESEKCELVSQAFADHRAEFVGAFSVLSRELLRIRNEPRLC
jgi:predicted nuclease of predicted toxin-antitoxin system